MNQPIQGNIFGASYANPYTQGASVFANTGYGSDGYSDPINKVNGTLSLYSVTLFEVSQQVYSNNRPSVNLKDTSSPERKEEDRLASQIDEYDKQLLSLKEQLQSLRLQGKRPDISTWGGNQDNLLGKCKLVLKTCQDYSENTDFHNSLRGVDWHLRGPIEVLSALQGELEECIRTFSQTSIYVNVKGSWQSGY